MTTDPMAHRDYLLDILWRCADAIGADRRSDSLPEDIRALRAERDALRARVAAAGETK